MKRYKSLVVAGLSLMLILLPLSGTPTSARQANLVLEYAVKFICGPAPATGVVAPGQYFTAINVHNPQNTTGSFRKKVAIALPKQHPGPVLQDFWAKPVDLNKR